MIKALYAGHTFVVERDGVVGDCKPTKGGAKQGCPISPDEYAVVQEYIIETMKLEWSEGVDIGQTDAIETIAQLVGLDKTSLVAAADSADNLEKLNASAQDAEKMNVIGVPTLVIEDQIFWGNDRLDFVREELEARGVAKS